ncbi:DNA/RNA helicase domain-containing protein [Geotalea sp. SG265]|uniref:DNA/RNA helicase domain-containing protein n=1 Tax=Geotalea sp. SG265 TaxID=2922867 RepID=UPI001FAF1AB7|nr:DNA/RNA helicase domain-containing protein [Geotalea sp. SG265]
MSYWKMARPNRTFNDQELQKIIYSICPTSDYSPTWSHRIQEDAERWLILTEEQQCILDTLLRHNRVVITGRSGTGKTLLALTYARQMSELGKSVLFLVFNKKLADKIYKDLSSTSVTVKTYHAFAAQLAKRIGKTLTLEGTDNTSEIINTALSNNLLPNYDVIVIDEAQVFNHEWIIALSCCYDHSSFLAFCDETQVFTFENSLSADEIADYIDSDKVQYLTINLRSPKKVFSRLYEALPKPDYQQASLRPEDNDALIELTTASPLSTLTETIKTLTARGINRNDIAVIYLDTDPSTLIPQCIKDSVSEIETIRRFRGLERPVVIVYAPESFTSTPEITCAYSRATTLCIVIFNAINFIEETKDPFQSMVKVLEAGIAKQLGELNFDTANGEDLVKIISATSNIQWSEIWNSYVMYHSIDPVEELYNLLWRFHLVIYEKNCIYEIKKPSFGAGKETVINSARYLPDLEYGFRDERITLGWCPTCGMWTRKTDVPSANDNCLDCKVRQNKRYKARLENKQYDDCIANPNAYEKEFKQKLSPFLIALGRLHNRLDNDQKLTVKEKVKGSKNALYEVARIFIGIDLLSYEVGDSIVANDYSEKLWNSMPAFQQITTLPELKAQVNTAFAVYYNTDKWLKKLTKGVYEKV